MPLGSLVSWICKFCFHEIGGNLWLLFLRIIFPPHSLLFFSFFKLEISIDLTSNSSALYFQSAVKCIQWHLKCVCLFIYLFSVLGFPFGSFYSFALLKFCIFSFISSMFFSSISEQSYSSCFKIFANSNPWVILGLVFINGVFGIYICLIIWGGVVLFFMSNNFGLCSRHILHWKWSILRRILVFDCFCFHGTQTLWLLWWSADTCLVLFTLIGLLGICSTCGV